MPVDFHLVCDDRFNHTRVFLILFCVLLAVELSVTFRQQLRYFKTQPARIYGPPLKLLGIVALPTLTAHQFVLLGGGLTLSLLGAALNFMPRLCLLLALCCYFIYFNPIMSLAYVQRKTNLIPIVLLVLMLAPAVGEPLTQAAPLWPLFLVELVIALMYFSAGVQKLRRGGLSWVDGKSLQAYLVEHYLWSDNRKALAVARHPRLCSALSALVLFWELTFWVILPRPQLMIPYVMAGVAFHLGTAVTMRISYLKYLGPVYTVFLPAIALQLRGMFCQ